MAVPGPSVAHHQPITSHAAPPPTRAEVQRRLSTRTKPQAPPVAVPVTSGNESDSSVASSSLPPPLVTAPLAGSHFATSPLTSPVVTPQGPGLSAIAERQGSSLDMGDDIPPHDLDLDDGDDSEDGGEGGKSGVEGQRVFKSGFLIKKQERRKTWKKKWFVLRSTSIAYYKDNREYSLSRAIDLKTVHSVVPVTQEKAKHPFSFAIVTADRTFFVEALSAEEREDWVRAINNVRKQMTDKDEDTRRRDKAVAVPVPTPSRGQTELDIETHPGTWTSTFSAGTTASASPTTTGSYFLRHPPSSSSFAPPAPIGHQPRSNSPSSNPNTLSTQMAGISVARSPSQKAMPPPSAAAVNRRLSNPIIHPPANLQGIQTPVRSQWREPAPPAPEPVVATHSLGPPAQTPQFVSSDEEEQYFSDPAQWGEAQKAAAHVSDPNKIIVTAYLMKKSRKTTREVWRKRWFYLTSAGMTYSKSHMDTRPLTFVPITTILDVFSIEDTDDDDVDESSDDSRPAQPTRGPSVRKQRDGAATQNQDQHIIRIVTNKRRFDLCAPSEEEEIKWIAAIRALVNREREKRQPGAGGAQAGAPGGSAAPVSPRFEAPGKLNAMPPPLSIPIIAQQPPTPGSVPPLSPSNVTNVSPPRVLADQQQQQPFTPTHGRSRSATQTAKNAVADVVRRFHEGQ